MELATTAGVVPQAIEDEMAKELKTNDLTRRQTLQGKAFQVNENSVEEGEPIGSQVPPQAPLREDSSSQPDRTKLQGKALQVNENSVEDGEPIGSQVPPQAPPRDPNSQPDRTKLQGKAFQVNENSVEEGEPIASSPPKHV